MAGRPLSPRKMASSPTGALGRVRVLGRQRGDAAWSPVGGMVVRVDSAAAGHGSSGISLQAEWVHRGGARREAGTAWGIQKPHLCGTFVFRGP